jgi:hypothetical protein
MKALKYLNEEALIVPNPEGRLEEKHLKCSNLAKEE